MGRKNSTRTVVSVGHSDRRTPAKHDNQSSFTGQEVSAAKHCALKLGVKLERIVLLDATAGDGTALFGRPWTQSCSPGIFLHHARYPKTGAPVHVMLNEINPKTFDLLLENIAREAPLLGYVRITETEWAHNGGSHPVLVRATLGNSHAIEDQGWGAGTFGVVSNDPNDVLRWAMPLEPLVATANRRGAFIRTFNTLGCNPGGLKAWNDRPAREAAYGNIQNEIAALTPTQDLILSAIERDDSQWAYLMTMPSKWVSNEIDRIQARFRKHGLEVNPCSMHREPERFEAMQDILFLTKKERATV